ncbi:MAG: gliding motility-associated C-terminal domain-containing protein [Flavobacteriales bacterium]|nr:gliding motility-associated C-terminal domain-containing protein [Flavobacteriales bacterium]
MNSKVSFLFKKIGIWILVAIPFLVCTRADADHIIGSDFTYKCSSTNDSIFEVTYNFYRDCNGCYVLGQSPKCGTSENCASSQTAPTSLSVKCISGGSFSGTLNLSRTAIVDITKTCKAVKSRCAQPCNGSFPYGIEKHVFEGTLDLRQAMKGGCCNFEISALLYVRSALITTGQQQQTFYTSCEINTCKAKCNTSPLLTNDPVAILCCNQPYVFNNGAVDNADYDSISYSFAPAFRGQNQQCSYGGNFTYDNPITVYYPSGLKFPYSNPNSNPPIGIRLDPLTGDLIFTPTNCGEIAVVVIAMTEWRKDTAGVYQKIGVTRRDMQFIVMSCPDNNPPTITNTKFSYHTCEGEQICFNVTTDDKVKVPPPPATPPDPDTVQLTWNRGIPGATFTIADPNARLKTGQFCWTPPIGTASTLPYSFTATVSDDACPLAASATRAFQVYVDPIAEAERDIDTFDCGKYSVSSTPFANFLTPAKYEWQLLDSTGVVLFDKGRGYFKSSNNFLSSKQNDTIQFRKGGKYIIKHTIRNKPDCPNFYYDTLVVPPLLEVDLAFGSDTFVCAGTTLRIEPKVSNANPPVTFLWRDGATTSYKNIKLGNNVTDTSFYVEIKDNSGCTAWDTTIVYLRPNPTVSLGVDRRICTYDTIHLVPQLGLAYWDDPRDTSQTTIQQGDTLYKTWFLDGLKISTDSQFVANIAGKYVIQITDSLGCMGQDTMILHVNDTVKADAGQDQVLCWNDVVVIAAGGLDTAGNAKSGWYVWNDITNPANVKEFSRDDTLKYNIKTTTDYQLQLYVIEDTTRCYDDDTVKITVNPLPTVKMPNDMAVCRDAGVITLNILEDAATKGGAWSVPAKPGLVIKSGTQYQFDTWNAGAIKDTTKRYKVYYRYIHPSTGCVRTDSFEIKVFPLPEVSIRDGYFCQDKGFVNFRDDGTIKLPSKLKLDLGTQQWNCLECGAYDWSKMLYNAETRFGFPANYEIDISENTIDLGSRPSDSIKIEFVFRSIDGCYGRDTGKIKIVKVPKIDFSPFPDLCWDLGKVDLKELSKVVPNDGTWYAINATGFKDSASFNQGLNGGFFQGDTLNTLQTAKPAKDGNFKYKLRYFHNLSGCPTFRDTNITIQGLPVPKINTTPLTGYVNNAPFVQCELDDDIALTSNYPGSGGKWSSKQSGAVSGSTFTVGSVTTHNKPFYINFDYTNSFGCKGKDSVLVEVHGKQEINLNPDIELCRTGDAMTVDIAASTVNASDFTWFYYQPNGKFADDKNTTTTFTFSTSADSTEKLLIIANTVVQNGTSANVCPTVEEYLNITIHPKPKAEIVADTLNGCNPVDVNFGVNMLNKVDATTSSYAWTYADGGLDNIQSPSRQFTDDGDNQVSLTITSEHNCDTTLTVNVEVYPIPVALFVPDPNNSTTAALPKFQFNNQSSVANVLNSTITENIWDFGDLSSIDDTSTQKSPLFFYPADTGSYDVTLKVRTQYGCEDQITLPVIIGPDILVFIPNAFSPDGGGPGVNEFFKPVVNDAIDKYHLVIFNRWGEAIWETTDKTEGWDGKYGRKKYSNREPVKADVYGYYLEVTSWNGNNYKYTGTVTLLR